MLLRELPWHSIVHRAGIAVVVVGCLNLSNKRVRSSASQFLLLRQLCHVRLLQLLLHDFLIHQNLLLKLIRWQRRLSHVVLLLLHADLLLRVRRGGIARSHLWRDFCFVLLHHLFELFELLIGCRILCLGNEKGK